MVRSTVVEFPTCWPSLPTVASVIVLLVLTMLPLLSVMVVVTTEVVFAGPSPFRASDISVRVFVGETVVVRFPDLLTLVIPTERGVMVSDTILFTDPVVV